MVEQNKVLVLPITVLWVDGRTEQGVSVADHRLNVKKGLLLVCFLVTASHYLDSIAARDPASVRVMTGRTHGKCSGHCKRK